MYCCSTLFLLGHAQWECPSLLRLGRGWLVWLLVEALVWPLGSITVGTESAEPLATKPPLSPVEFPFPLDSKQNFKSRGISPGEVSQLHPYPCMSCSHMRCAGRDSKSPDLLGVPKYLSPLMRHNMHPTHPQQSWDIRLCGFCGTAHNRVLANGAPEGAPCAFLARSKQADGTWSPSPLSCRPPASPRRSRSPPAPHGLRVAPHPPTALATPASGTTGWS